MYLASSLFVFFVSVLFTLQLLNWFLHDFHLLFVSLSPSA